MKKRVFLNPVIGDKATLIKTAEETNGEFTLLEVELVPGGGNALHAADGLVDKKSMPRNLLHTAVLVSMAGTIPTGIIKLFIPLFQVIASFSKKTEAELINKYC
jgi:hypothetical protein